VVDIVNRTGQIAGQEIPVGESIMRTFHVTLAAGLIAIGAVASVQAQMSAPGKDDPAAVTAGTYTLDAGHTLVGWKVDHFGFNDYFGLFGSITGTLQLDPANVSAAKLDITIPVSKVTTASEGLTAHLLRDGKDASTPADFFGSAPADAKFVSTSVTGTSATEATIAGNLTLNGVTKPVSIKASFAGAGKNPFSQKETVGFHGTATIKRSEFNINYAVPMVADEVHLDITAAFEK
jgi:polyisoprenoid-binding protein YceI